MPVMPARLCATVLVAAIAAVATTLSATQATPKFYSDDPMWTLVDTQDASGVEESEVDLTVDVTINLFGRPGDSRRNVRALSINTVDEVPDSNWFVNRAGRLPLTADDVARGPDVTDGPAAGTWLVTSAKSDGVTPGFTIRDAAGRIWFLKFDPPAHRGMATGTEVAVNKLMWALGFHVPEYHVAALHRDQLTIGPTATVRSTNGIRRLMQPEDIDALLKQASRDADGSYRVSASLALPGASAGHFRFHGTRPDDPNDIVPHEHRRELRGYGTFAAWLNHVDAKAGNTKDTLVTENGRVVVRHWLLDFGSTLGSGGVWPREAWEGSEYMVEPADVGRGIRAFGFFVKPWRTVDLYTSPTIGSLPRDNSTFDPDGWRPRVPNAAFVRARADDKFWAATKLAAISDDMIRAAIREGQFDDEDAERFLAGAIIERRDAILRAYLPAINPVTLPSLGAGGVLTFGNAAVDAGVAEAPSGYRAEWFTFDNLTRNSMPVGETSGAASRLDAPSGLPTAPGSYIRVEITATGGRASWNEPVHAYFVRTIEGWRLVGFERQP